MSQLNSGYERKPHDLYETPAWVTEALIPFIPKRCNIWEPACGSGKMVDVLAKSFHVLGSDIRGTGINYCMLTAVDFLEQSKPPSDYNEFNAIITNPPYKDGMAQKFIEHALELTAPTSGFVAMLLRTDYDHAKTRTHLFRDCHAFVGKVVLLKRITWFVEADGKPKASPSENHAWFLWDWTNTNDPTIAYAPAKEY